MGDLSQVWQKMAVRFLHDDSLTAPAAIGVSSAVRGEGRTTVSISLANALAWETGDPVALVECDIAKPSLAAEMGLRSGPGIAGLLIGAELEEVLVPTEVENLSVIPAGELLAAGTASMTAEEATVRLRHQVPALLTRLKGRFAYIVLDLPPLLGNAHADGIARQLDGTILVVRGGKTQLDQLEQAVALLGQDRVKGVVHLGTPASTPAWLQRFVSE
jgi:non-specific protein-tyrosine kinase